MDSKDSKPRYITVRTAHTAPGWLPWFMYAVLCVSGYMFIKTGIEYWLLPIWVTAVVMTYLFFNTYNALVHMYNDKRIKDAIMAEYKPKEKQGSKAQVQAAGTVHAGSKVLGSEPTEVDKGVVSSKDRTLRRLTLALQWITDKAVEIGEARDVAWRALNHDTNATNVKEWNNGKAEKEAKDK